MRFPRRSPLWLLAALLVAACASASEATPAGNPFERSQGGESEDILLTVENNDFRDATIYVYWNGSRTRAGTVTGKTSHTFRMKWRSEYVELGVDFLGGGGYTTERVGVTQGDHLNFVITGMR